ncbi:aspartic peptidase A1 [Phanerochaete sordida]|uniref:Aspartic peptidase A1 n=1 Tax=Phanerochaete sordida TaxID=48140 RepID=A0A9P3G799_9APHY|nr:aspartic peptidase A1 [Phanerochaete sordida]
MHLSQSFAALVALALAVSASPVVQDTPKITLPFAKHINATGTLNLLAQDQARAKWLKNRSSGAHLAERAGSIPVTNTAVSYLAAVGVGSPATTYNLIVDTGSSNTWVGAGTKYKQTSTAKSTGKSVSVSYGSGSFSGTEWTDQVTLGSLVISGQSIGVASRSSGFSGTDGILGIGPVDLTQGTVSGSNSVPTVTDNLLSQGTISTEVVAVSFEPTTQESVTNGELTFGGTDSTKFTGSITYTSLTKTSPASEYWGINQSITYGSTSILSSTAGIVDTGTTLTLIASDALSKYQKATGATLDNNTGLLRITTAQFNSLQNLNFAIGGTTFTLTPNAQIWPRALNSFIGGDSSHVYLIVGDLGSDSGEGLDFINGQTFLERFYSVFDTTNKRLGLATTSFTTATTN